MIKANIIGFKRWRCVFIVYIIGVERWGEMFKVYIIGINLCGEIINIVDRSKIIWITF